MKAAARATFALLAFALPAFAPLGARAEPLQRLTVTSFTLSADTAKPELEVPFHLIVSLHVRENVPEIGNITLGSAACCQTKDALDGVELGQVNSYVTGIKWVSPSGELMEASETNHPELLPFIRASYGLAGIVYEVTFKVKPL